MSNINPYHLHHLLYSYLWCSKFAIFMVSCYYSNLYQNYLNFRFQLYIHHKKRIIIYMILEAKDFESFYLLKILLIPDFHHNFHLNYCIRLDFLGNLDHIRPFNYFYFQNDCLFEVLILLIHVHTYNLHQLNSFLNCNYNINLSYRDQEYKEVLLNHERNYTTFHFCIIPFKTIYTFLFSIDLAFIEVNYKYERSYSLNLFGNFHIESYDKF